MTTPERVRHNLGLGFGSIYTYDDGTVEYIKGLSTIFKVRAQEVTGFTVTKGSKWFNRNFQIHGHGTTLAVLADVGVGDGERIEKIIRDHPKFAQNDRVSGAGSVADELKKLADLHASGVLSDVEFQKLKERLIS